MTIIFKIIHLSITNIPNENVCLFLNIVLHETIKTYNDNTLAT